MEFAGVIYCECEHKVVLYCP
uniref:Uncharacterized protein n=1 Tax=Anguilla anguilla TaxID=7936 RepID=A0A0E9W8M5_ANGAN